MDRTELKRRNKLALRYLFAAVGLFLVGYGTAWLSEQGVVKNAFKKDTVSVPSATPASTNDPRRDLPNTEEPKTKEGRQYTIEQGDTISSIAEANGMAFEDLAKHNDIPYPYNLTVGQIIYIPEKSE